MHLIDGHNLIPKVPGWSLRNIDDEQQLIEALQAYVAAHGRDIEVFFDKAPPGFSGMRRFGRITAHFVRAGQTADDAIRARLDQLGKSARNVTVVSSDRQVQSEARNHQAKVVSSEDFAAELATLAARRQGGKKTNARGESLISPDELEDWLRMFGEDDQ
jgi:predicted RNA-binding protein with PIN domain